MNSCLFEKSKRMEVHFHVRCLYSRVPLICPIVRQSHSLSLSLSLSLDKIASCSLSFYSKKATMMMTITASLSCHFKRNKEPSDTPCLLNVLSDVQSFSLDWVCILLP